MSEVLKAQQRTNQNLEEQFRRANETQEFQTEAMQDMAQANFQMKFDHMFSSVPIYDGTDPDTFDDWLYQIESLCEMSHRDVRIELMGWASAHVKCIIRSIPLDIEWEVAQRELKRCLTEEKSRAQPQVVQQPQKIQPQKIQVPNTAAQVMQMPATPGPSTAGNMQNLQGTVRYIRIPAGTTKATYNLRPATPNNSTTVNIPAMVTMTPVTAGRSQNNLQMAQVEQELPTPGNVTMPKSTSATTIVIRGKGRGKKAPTVSVLDTTSETGEYYMEMDEDDLEDGDSDATEFYETLANINDPEIEEVEINMEPEMEPPI